MEYYLFGTSGCHLCEQAESLINKTVSPINFQQKDIVENQQWIDKYAIRIPVLYHIKSRQELGWPFDAITLQQFIDKVCKQR